MSNGPLLFHRRLRLHLAPAESRMATSTCRRDIQLETGPTRSWFVVRDDRFELDYKIAGHSDYWDFIGALSRPQAIARRRRASGGLTAPVATSGRTH